ncbi:hypothetical protein SAMN05421505_120102 [Sinosporangium album]|uniref:Uncharacterized protein n=1 Tax=Sinosporangium album TaxID=504805 RepID=A0A1G8EHH2_9ACTN|nr:hypothetical protein [Sinosporangium album]SDH69281.1 hypothetical protein SAMN05421505_120102 [Sinosporangium album]
MTENTPLSREDASSVYLAGRLLEEIAKKLIALGGEAMAARTSDDLPVLPAGDCQSGYLGGLRLGSTRMDPPKITASLRADDPELVQWALDSPHYRHNVLTVQVLAPAVVEQIKKHAAKVGAPVDPNGEIVPGLTVTTGDPTPYKQLHKPLRDELVAPERIHALALALLAGEAALPGRPAPALTPLGETS